MARRQNIKIHTHKHGLKKIFPPPPLNKVEVHKVYKICKRCLTCNIQHCSGGRELHFPRLKRKVSQTFWPGLSELQSYLLTQKKSKYRDIFWSLFSGIWIPDGIRAKKSRNIQNHSNLRDIRSSVVKNGHCAFYLVHGNYDELLQLSNVVAFNHNDDYNKQIAVRENDIVYIPAPVP